MVQEKGENPLNAMRRKVNEAKAIFDEIYNVYKNVKPKCKGKIVNHTVKKKRSDIRKLEKYADALFQQAGRIMFPVSEYSGKETEVIHHYVCKSHSNNLRYDFKNAIPLTNGEHYRHHKVSDSSIMSVVLQKRGLEWDNDLQTRRHIVVKQSKELLEKVISDLETIIYGKPKQLPWE